MPRIAPFEVPAPVVIGEEPLTVAGVVDVARHGAPEILCVWGLGVNEALLDACQDSIRIYNSIDADPIRIPPEVSRHFDIFLTGSDWQSERIHARHPAAICEVLPIGPDFASDLTFHPTGAAKDYDVVYVRYGRDIARFRLDESGAVIALDAVPASVLAG